MKYVFNNHNFKSKTNFDVYIRGIIQEIINNNESLIIGPNNKWYDFLNERVNVHNEKDEKLGCGIEHFYFIKGNYGENQLRILRKDLSHTDCSYMYSKITQTNKTINQNNSLKSALRHAIYNQTMDFKKVKYYL